MKWRWWMSANSTAIPRSPPAMATPTRLKGVPTILVVDPADNKVINGEQVFALSNAGHQTPQDLADYLARWTDPIRAEITV